MPRKIRGMILALGLILGSPSMARSQDFPYDQFESTTLAAAVHRYESETADGQSSDIVIKGPIFRRRVQAVYTGQHRATDPQTISFYQYYEKAHAVQNSQSDIYHETYLFQEAGVDYWLPVQDQVASYFPKELEAGDTIYLYLLVPGGYRRTGSWNWVFLVEEFRAGS